MDAKREAFEAWRQEAAALTGQKQLDAVVVKLSELNAAFDGKVTRKIENGVVLELSLSTDNVTDLSPVAVLKGLRKLSCQGSDWGHGKLLDLSPLKGLPLNELACGKNELWDLAPLQGMPLESLSCEVTDAADLALLKGMALTKLLCSWSDIADLSPLKTMPLKELGCDFRAERDAGILRAIKNLETINGKPTEEFWDEVNSNKLKKK